MGPFGISLTVFAAGVITKSSNRFLRIFNPLEERFFLEGRVPFRGPRELLVPEGEGDKDGVDSMVMPMIEHFKVDPGGPIVAELDPTS